MHELEALEEIRENGCLHDHWSIEGNVSRASKTREVQHHQSFQLQTS